MHWQWCVDWADWCVKRWVIWCCLKAVRQVDTVSMQWVPDGWNCDRECTLLELVWDDCKHETDSPVPHRLGNHRVRPPHFLAECRKSCQIQGSVCCFSLYVQEVVYFSCSAVFYLLLWLVTCLHHFSLCRMIISLPSRWCQPFNQAVIVNWKCKGTA